MIAAPVSGPPFPPVFSIGHSTRTIAEFVDLLRAGDVRLVVDIRTVPRSRANPQYNAEPLAASLAEHQIGYRRIEALGGLRKRSAEVPPEVNGFWTNQSFHNYADYALSAEFERGFGQLLELAAAQRTAMMCAEAVWWRCHRRIVADYLLRAGRTVIHLMGHDRLAPATMTPAARPAAEGIAYPASGGD